MKKLLLCVSLLMLSVATWADVYTDGIAKRVAAGQITITVADSPIMQDFFDKSAEQMRQGVIEYIATLFRDNMTEKEFGDWMKYKPTKADIAYEDNLNAMLEKIQKPLDDMINPQGVSVLLAEGQDAPRVTPKSCTPEYKQVFNQFLDSNIINALLQLQQWKTQLDQAGQDPQAQYNIELIVNKRAFPICYDNVMNTLLNACIDNYSEQQLKDFAKSDDQPFAKAIKKISLQTQQNLNKLFEAAYGTTTDQLDARMEQKRETLIQKYGHQEINFNVNFNGVKKFYK